MAIRNVEGAVFLRMSEFALGMAFLFLSIYAFNAYCGYRIDALNPRLRHVARQPRPYYLWQTSAFLVTGLLVLGLLELWLAAAGGLSFILWALYSLPKVGWKSVPVLGTLVHFVTQILHFMMGWSLFAPVDPDAFLIAAYFAALFAAGHLHHEVIDYEADGNAGMRTLAIRIGRRQALVGSSGVFLAGGLYWVGLYANGIVDRLAFLPFLGAMLAHAVTVALFAYRGWLDEQTGVLRLRGVYRSYYLLAGIVYVTAKVLTLWGGQGH